MGLGAQDGIHATTLERSRCRTITASLRACYGAMNIASRLNGRVPTRGVSSPDGHPSGDDRPRGDRTARRDPVRVQALGRGRVLRAPLRRCDEGRERRARAHDLRRAGVPRAARRRLRQPLLRCPRDARAQRPCNSFGVGAALRGAVAARDLAAPVRARRHERAHQPGPAGRARRDVRGARPRTAPRLARARRLPARERPAREGRGAREGLLPDGQARIRRPDRPPLQPHRRRRRDVEGQPRPRRRVGERRDTLGAPRRHRPAAEFVATLDRMVGFAGRGLLIPADTLLRRVARAFGR